MRKLENRELQRLLPEEYLLAPKLPVVLVLDNIRSALNVGSAFRTADAFRVERIVLCGITAVPPHREILKTAIGASDTVQWEYAQDTVEAVKSLHAAGYQIISVEQTNKSVDLQNFIVQNDLKYALVFGNEVGGVQDEVISLSDGSIEIPQIGTKHSLNISVCIGIVIWHFFTKSNLL